jgi:tetratricopeptide (TPR) repeat protein
MKAACGLVALGVALASGGAAAAPPVRERTLESLAESYRGGERARALAELRLWSEDRIVLEAERLRAATPRPAFSNAELRRSLLAAAALLTEAGIADARDQVVRAVRQVHAASRLVRLLPVRRGCAECDAFARPFAILAVSSLLSWSHIEPAHELAVQGLRDFPQEAELWLALGSIQEIVAGFRTYDPSPDALRRGRHSLASGTYTVEGHPWGPLEGRLPPASLAQAERDYLEALRIDPGSRAARLRLGNVRVLQGRAAEAVPDLERVALESPLAAERYLARLFEGRGRERLGDIEGAVAAYSAAVEAVPFGQTAELALGRVLDLVGERARAQEALSAAARYDVSAVDPWWDYCAGRLDRSVFEARLRRLVEAVP